MRAVHVWVISAVNQRCMTSSVRKACLCPGQKLETETLMTWTSPECLCAGGDSGSHSVTQSLHHRTMSALYKTVACLCSLTSTSPLSPPPVNVQGQGSAPGTAPASVFKKNWLNLFSKAVSHSEHCSNINKPLLTHTLTHSQTLLNANTRSVFSTIKRLGIKTSSRTVAHVENHSTGSDHMNMFKHVKL